MKFSRSPLLDFFASLGLFLLMVIVGYSVLSVEIEGAGDGFKGTIKRPVIGQFSRPMLPAQTYKECGQRLDRASSSNKTQHRPRPKSKEGTPTEQVKSMQAIVSLVDTGDWKAAESELLKYLKAHPKDEGALVELAMIQLIDKKDSKAAMPYLERAAAVNPQNESILNELLVLYQETDSLGAGLKFLKSLPKEDLSGVLDYSIGSTLNASGKSEEAIEYLYRSLDGDRVDQVLAKEELADAFLDTGRVDEALHMFGELMEQVGSQDKRRTLTVKSATALVDRCLLYTSPSPRD